MFNKKENRKEEVQYSRASSIIDKDCYLEGMLRAKGTLRIDGSFKGEIVVDGNLFIGETGKIIGNIQVNNLMVAGEIQGNITAAEQLRIATGGSLYGDVWVKSFILDENAIFEGSCKMQKESSSLADDREPVVT
ncbi:bactofilin family protein [Alkaliphilus crotonatoxidans]